MRAFIQCDKNYRPLNINVFNALLGFEQMGIECVMFYKLEELEENYHSKNDIIVGGIGMIRKRLTQLGIEVENYDYPEEIKKYLGRNIWKSTINTVCNHPEKWPIFVKSVEQKFLTGKVIAQMSDIVGCGADTDYDVFCSEAVNMVSEWRVFVRYGKVLDVRHYYGDWRKTYDPTIIEQCIKDFTSAPDAYGIDFAVTDKGETILIEVNDGFALGCYGLFHTTYAKFLITRWSQIVNNVDEYFYL